MNLSKFIDALKTADRVKMKVIYKVTYPNGKIYVGKDLVYNMTYFGSPKYGLIGQDFSWEEQQKFTITKEILWWSESATDEEVSRKEVELIRQNRSNDPSIGYNQWPKFKKTGCRHYRDLTHKQGIAAKSPLVEMYAKDNVAHRQRAGNTRCSHGNPLAQLYPEAFSDLNYFCIV